MTRCGRWWVTCGGLGHMRPAPGTWGSLPPCVAGGVLILLGVQGGWVWYGVMAGFAAVFSWACVRFGEGAEGEFGRKDPSAVVADETAGMGLTLCFVPWWWLVTSGATVSESAWRTGLNGLGAVAAAFVLFRVMDILKLPPAHGLQRLRGGWGILVDDLIAGVQAGVVLVGLVWGLRAGGALG